MKFIASFCVLSFLILFWLGNALAQSLETPIVYRIVSDSAFNYKRELAEIKTENKILKERVDILNSTNDKILNSVYWTIGAILTALFGLTVWNGIKNRDLDVEKFKIVLENYKNDLDNSLNVKLKEAVKKNSVSEISSLKSETYKLSTEFERFKIYSIAKQLKYHPFWDIYDDRHLFEYYLKFVVSTKIDAEYKHLLETVINYLKTDPYMSLDDRNKILNFVNTECSDPKYNIYVDQVKQSIEKLT